MGDQMKSKLKRIDQSSLTPEQKIQFKQLWGKVNNEKGGTSEYGNSVIGDYDPYPLQTWGIIISVAAFLVYGHYKNNIAHQTGQGGGFGNALKLRSNTDRALSTTTFPGSKPAASMTDDQRNAMREARLRHLDRPISE